MTAWDWVIVVAFAVVYLGSIYLFCWSVSDRDRG